MFEYGILLMTARNFGRIFFTVKILHFLLFISILLRLFCWRHRKWLWILTIVMILLSLFNLNTLLRSVCIVLKLLMRSSFGVLVCKAHRIMAFSSFFLLLWTECVIIVNFFHWLHLFLRCIFIIYFFMSLRFLFLLLGFIFNYTLNFLMLFFSRSDKFISKLFRIGTINLLNFFAGSLYFLITGDGILLRSSFPYFSWLANRFLIPLKFKILNIALRVLSFRLF